MSDNWNEEYENSNDFHQKLRYFNEMVGEIHSLLALEPGDIRGTQDAERNLAAELVCYRAASEAVEQARVALETAETMRNHAATQMRLVADQEPALVQATIETVESRRYVRPRYKSGLRGIFAGTDSDDNALPNEVVSELHSGNDVETVAPATGTPVAAPSVRNNPFWAILPFRTRGV